MGDHAALDFTRHVLTLGANRIDFVNEDDGGGVVGGFVENLTKLFLRFTVILGDDFGPVDALEMRVDFGRHGLRNHRFPRSGWTVEKHTFGWVNAQAAEEFRVLERQFDHLSDLQQLLPDTTNVLVGDAFGLTDVFLGHSFVFDHDLRVRGHHHDALGHGLDNGKRQGFSKQGHTGDENTVAGNHRSLGETALRKALDARSKLDLLLVGHDRGNRKFGAGFGVHFADRHTVAEADASVLANDAVHADDVHFCILGSAAPIDGSRRPLFAADLNEITGFEVQAHLRGDASPAKSDVGGDGFGYAQFDGVVVVCHGAPSSPINISRYIMKFKRAFRL